MLPAWCIEDAKHAKHAQHCVCMATNICCLTQPISDVQLLDATLSHQQDFFRAPPGSSVALLVNNMGSMAGLELPIIVRAAVQQLRARQVCPVPHWMQHGASCWERLASIPDEPMPVQARSKR